MLCVEAAVVCSVVAIVLLVASDSLSRTVEHFTTFSSGHTLTGAFPIPPETSTIETVRFLVPVLVIVSFWFVVARLRGRRSLELADG